MLASRTVQAPLTRLLVACRRRPIEPSFVEALRVDERNEVLHRDQQAEAARAGEELVAHEQAFRKRNTAERTPLLRLGADDQAFDSCRQLLFASAMRADEDAALRVEPHRRAAVDAVRHRADYTRSTSAAAPSGDLRTFAWQS